jgi:formamidopyrimidine-DNA glycosylase
MIELPEAVTVARQMTEVLVGRCIQACSFGNLSHEPELFTYSPEEYKHILQGRKINTAQACGKFILTDIGDGYSLCFGDGEERILYHRNHPSVNFNFHFLLQFDHDAYLTVTAKGKAAIWLMNSEDIAENDYLGDRLPSPLDAEFSITYFTKLVKSLQKDDPRSVKYFITRYPGIEGVGEGYLQDILFRARIHPRREVVSLKMIEIQLLYKAIRVTMQSAVDLNGRDTGFDLFGNPGMYIPKMDTRSLGKPCDVCGTPIMKEIYLGGEDYFCPMCQATA